MLTITLPFPDPHLLPNHARRLHWRVRAAYAQPYRMQGRVETLNALSDAPFVVNENAALKLELVFHPPTRRRYDLDGMLSAMKPACDGIADALEIDDTVFEPIVLRRGEVIKGGCVTVTIGA